MKKQILLKHGISENGELQVYRVDQIVKDGKVLTEKTHPPYSPKDPKNMEGFDAKSIELVSAIEDKKVKADFVSQTQSQRVESPLGDLVWEIKYDRMVDELGRIAVRKITRFYDRDIETEEVVEIGKKYHRSWIMPGDDPGNADVLSKALAVKLHTPEVIAAYKAKMAEIAELK